MLSDDIHICPDCGKRYSTSSNLARHRQTHRSVTDKKARKCPHCDKVYVSMPAYSMHVRTHTQGCVCRYFIHSFLIDNIQDYVFIVIVESASVDLGYCRDIYVHTQVCIHYTQLFNYN